MAQGAVEIDLVVVSATDPGAFDVATFHQVGDDRLSGALGDPDAGGDIPAPDAGVTGDADQHMTMVGEERPAWLCRDLGDAIGMVHGPKRSCLRETSHGSR